MIKIFKQNILAILLGITLVIIIFFTILFFLRDYKQNQFKLFSSIQEQKLKELESVIGIYNKENKDKLQTSERIFFDKINSSNPISKLSNDSIYVDVINNGISQKVKISKLLINNEILYLNNKLLINNRYITNTYVSIWQKSKDGYIRIASSKAGLIKEDIPILLKKSNIIIKNVEDGKHYYSRNYLGFDSELSVFAPIYINGSIEGFAQFTILEFIPATIGRIYNYKNSGFFLLNRKDAKLLGNNTVFDIDKDEFLIKKVLSLKNSINEFEYDDNMFYVLYCPENQIYIGFYFNEDTILTNFYSYKKHIIIWFVLISVFILVFFIIFSFFNNKNNKSNILHFANLFKVNKYGEDFDIQEDDTLVDYLDKYYLNISDNILKLSEGDTSIEILPEFKENEINNSLTKIQDTLLNATTDRKKQETENIVKQRFEKGNIEITSLLQYVTNLEDLSFNILKSITKFLRIQQGAMFILNEKDSNNPIFEMSASYAYDKRRVAHKSFSITEGLIGRAYLEKESIYITEVPENYTLITSGFGEEEPKFLLIVPLIFNNKVQAVIELGGINKIEEYEIKFVETIGENIASTISNLKHSNQTEELLYQTTAQSKEIEEQRQTLEEKINTHRRQNRKLDKEMLQLIEIIESIKSVTFMFEYDLNGEVVDVSKKVIDLWGVEKKDIINKHHKNILKGTDYDKKYNKFWLDLNKNIPQTIDEVIIINGKEYTFTQNYVPIKNVRRKIFRFLSLGTLKS